MNIEKCADFMVLKHGNQKRKQGTPYYTHPLAVARLLAEKGYGEDAYVAGLFHDLLEDTDATQEEILALSNEIVLEAVKLVTKEKGYNMDEYMERIMNNPIARAVKLADRVHNLSESKAGSEKFQRKYIKETEAYFIKLAEGTPFEEDIKRELTALKEYVGEER